MNAIPKLKFTEPRWNLPGRKGVATFEDRFTIAFTRAYLEQFKAIHSRGERTELVCAREIPVNGYGIADLAVVAWKPAPGLVYDDIQEFSRMAKPIIRAFEMKLSDWRKGLSQAGRYKYFANQSILVLPEKLVSSGKVNVETFRLVGTGLWSFDLESGRIRSVSTPRPRKPKCDRHYLDALRKIHHAATPALPIL
jgi:hypothetical protein